MLDSYGFDMWADAYDRAVKAADESNSYPFAGYKQLMNAIYGTVMEKRPASVLDVGIGTGTLSFRLYEAGNRITGIDFSQEMLRQSRAKMPDADLIQFDFTKGLPPALDGVKFDFIVSTYALHHLRDDRKAEFIRELLGHVNQAGAILIGDVAFETRAELERCKELSGDEWDDDEFYLVFSELKQELQHDCALSYHPFSHCSGIIEIHPGTEEPT